jgi:hypothetical protein
VVDFTHKSEGGLIGSPLQLGTITFQADETEGTSALEIFVNLLRDPDEADITFAPPTNGEVVIQQLALKQGDADCNNSVNSVDALLILRTSGPPACRPLAIVRPSAAAIHHRRGDPP